MNTLFSIINNYADIISSFAEEYNLRLVFLLLAIGLGMTILCIKYLGNSRGEK